MHLTTLFLVGWLAGGSPAALAHVAHHGHIPRGHAAGAVAHKPRMVGSLQDQYSAEGSDLGNSSGSGSFVSTVDSLASDSSDTSNDSDAVQAENSGFESYVLDTPTESDNQYYDDVASDTSAYTDGSDSIDAETIDAGAESEKSGDRGDSVGYGGRGHAKAASEAYTSSESRQQSTHGDASSGSNHNHVRRAAGPTPPPGVDTTNFPRPLLGSVPYGPAKILTCNNPGQIALTFDDGPHEYTPYLLDLLASNSIKATFFITGDNYGRGFINDQTTPWPALIQRMIREGHQIASHTWTHPQLSSLTETVRRREMIYNEIAMNSVLGFMPTYMRPPYGDCDSKCGATMRALGYHIIIWNQDTQGYNNDDAQAILNSERIWDSNAGSASSTSSWINLEHDHVYYGVHVLLPYMINSIKAKGYKTVTVGECLNDPPQNWYRDKNGNGVNPYSGNAQPPPPSPTSVSPPPASTGSPSENLPVGSNGSCGNGFKCPSGQCCSQYGWCGVDDTYCGSGCQSAYGSCGAAPPPSPSSPAGTRGESPDGSCGFGGYTCPGSQCCSQYGWCGVDSTYCGTGCQAGYGVCN